MWLVVAGVLCGASRAVGLCAVCDTPASFRRVHHHRHHERTGTTTACQIFGNVLRGGGGYTILCCASTSNPHSTIDWVIFLARFLGKNSIGAAPRHFRKLRTVTVLKSNSEPTRIVVCWETVLTSFRVFGLLLWNVWSPSCKENEKVPESSSLKRRLFFQIFILIHDFHHPTRDLGDGWTRLNALQTIQR